MGLALSYLQLQGTLQPDAVMGHLKETKPEILHILCGECL